MSHSFKAKKAVDKPIDIEPGFLQLLGKIEPGEYIITVSVRNTELESYKRHFFAQIDKLAKFAGYMTTKDKELFKQQISEHCGCSITEIVTIEDMKIRMEQVHQLASNLGFFFEPYTPK